MAKSREIDAPNALPKDNGLPNLVNEQAAKDAWVLILALRCINALLVQTFFQPDEYFQSLEPAWQLAFGPDSGAWITWEWDHQLRSSLHPALFAAVYYVADEGLRICGTFPQFRAMILSVLPNLVQAYFAALGDYYTWQLAQRMYGTGSKTSRAALWMTILSPWQWFCSTRTFSNCLETTMTITALYFWPWTLTTDTVLGKGSDLSQQTLEDDEDDKIPTKSSEPRIFSTYRSVNHLRISLVLAATACILRPTNLLIWFTILTPTLLKLASPKRAASSDYIIFFCEAFLMGCGTLVLSAACDYYYFGEFTFPPYQWLHFNVSQDLAVFYGRNDWHYYLSQGLPLLLTTYLPFALVALYQATSLKSGDIRFLFTTTIFGTLATMSLVAHKEVRFIYPLLPILHILTAPVISEFFRPSLPASPSIERTSTTIITSQPAAAPLEPASHTRYTPLLFTLLGLNIFIAYYTTQVHQRAVLSVLPFLRHEYETLALDTWGRSASDPSYGVDNTLRPLAPNTLPFSQNDTFVAFLTPCHSTPWRSSLYHPFLHAWALTCSPPIHIPAHTPEREAYRDEADRFYDDPVKFLREEVGKGERMWPRFVVGFEGIEGVVRKAAVDREVETGEEIGGWGVKEVWREKNSDWHDDWRRTGDLVVWELVDGSTSGKDGNIQ